MPYTINLTKGAIMPQVVSIQLDQVEGV